MDTRTDETHLPIPQTARGLVRRTSALAARALDGLARLDPHLLILGSEKQAKRTLVPALKTVCPDELKIIFEPDPVAFTRRATATGVEGVVVMADAMPNADEAFLPLRGLIKRLSERVPTMLATSIRQQLVDAFVQGFDIVTPQLRFIPQVAHSLEDLLRLRTLFRDGCGQGALDADRPDGFAAPRGRVALVDAAGSDLDLIAEQLIEMGVEWKAHAPWPAATRTLFHNHAHLDLILVRAPAPGLTAVDLLRVLRQGDEAMPPCVLYGDALSPLAAEMAWHAGAWAWCRTERLRDGMLPDLVRRGMNVSRARRRESASLRGLLRTKSTQPRSGAQGCE